MLQPCTFREGLCNCPFARCTATYTHFYYTPVDTPIDIDLLIYLVTFVFFATSQCIGCFFLYSSYVMPSFFSPPIITKEHSLKISQSMSFEFVVITIDLLNISLLLFQDSKANVVHNLRHNRITQSFESIDSFRNACCYSWDVGFSLESEMSVQPWGYPISHSTQSGLRLALLVCSSFQGYLLLQIAVIPCVLDPVECALHCHVHDLRAPWRWPHLVRFLAR